MALDPSVDPSVAGPADRPPLWRRPPGGSGWTKALRLLGAVGCVLSLAGGGVIVVWAMRGGINIFGWWLIQGFTKFIVAAGGLLGGLGLGLSILVIANVLADTADNVASWTEPEAVWDEADDAEA
jgi:hypothetical protein